MTMPANLHETEVLDSKGGKMLVRPGGKVDILPVSLMEQDKEDGDYFAKQDFKRLRQWLGKGPYVISWIGQWPCGKVMIYLKLPQGREPGVYASSLMGVN